jgi:3-hydroxyisobutyrate dehydrogenase-like beta-hydroxyacid dehydrogenase
VTATENTVGVIGLGRMGGPMAGHLARGGYAVTGCDPDAAARLAAGSTVDCLSGPAEVMRRAFLTLVVVPGDEDVVSVCTGPDGLFSDDAAGRIVGICSSVRKETVESLAEPAGAAGVDLLDIPLTKGVQAAIDGEMTILVGGDARVLERARPVLDCFATGVHHVGGLGAGQVAKTVNNLLLWSALVAVSESLRFGAALGVAPADLLPALKDCSADSWVLREYANIQPTWPVKDMENALAMAEQAGLVLPLMDEVARVIAGYDRPALDRILSSD